MATEDSTIMSLLNNPIFIKSFAAFNITWIAAVGGAAIGMYLFSIPVIETAQPFSTKVMLRQFHHLITNGRKYLQTGSRIQGVTMAALTWLAYRHPDPRIHQTWTYFATAAFIGAQVAWYEVVFVFPINDTLVEMEGRLDKVDDDGKTDKAMRPDVIKLLEQWRTWHIGRIVIPFAVVAIMVSGFSL